MTANLVLAAREAALDAYIAFAPAGSKAAFASMVAPGTAFVLADGSRAVPPGVEGIGTCLLQAACALSETGYGGVVPLNSDSPRLPTALLIEAARHLLAGRDRVMLVVPSLKRTANGRVRRISHEDRQGTDRCPSAPQSLF